jgi:isocitrate dehydrogenase (NAD+)
MLSGVLMLRHLGEQGAAERVEGALRTVIAEGRRTTSDLGGEAGTSQFADAVIEELGRTGSPASSGAGTTAGSAGSPA